MFDFQPARYGPAAAELLDMERLPELGPGRPNREAEPKLAALTMEALFGGAKVDDSMASGCLAGLWLHHDFLDRSHEISQEIQSQAGSYWHGIMHRREPDYFNAKYWFRKVGRHGLFGGLLAAAREEAAGHPAAGKAQTLVNGTAWDAYRFIDLCQQAAESGDGELSDLCRRIARAEWRLLFDACHRAAVGR